MQWSRVKSREQLSAAKPRVYDVRDDLAAYEMAAKQFSARWYDENAFVFHPDDFKGRIEQLTPEQLELAEE